MNNASQGQSAGMSKAKRSISWHTFSPWQNSSALGSAHGLSKALLQVVKVVQVVFSYSTGPPTCSFVNKKSSAVSKKVSISRGNLSKKGTFPRLIDMFFSSDTKPIVSCYGHARLDQHLPLPVFSPANALDQAFLL